MINLIKKNTWLIILLAISVGFFVPKVGLLLKPFLNYFLMALMFLSCLDINLKDVVESFVDYKKQILVLMIVHLAAPLLVLFLKDYLSPEIFLGLILASTVSAGRSAVFLSNIYGGEPTKALVVTTISNTISPIMVPLVVWFLAHSQIRMEPMEMGITILKLVVIPIVLAILARYLGLAKQLVKPAPSISILILFFIIWGIISPIRSIILGDWSQSIWLIFIVSALILVDFGLGYLVGSEKSEKITFAISASYKNYTLATIIALSLFSPIVALPAIIYTICNNLLLIPLQLIVPKKA